jgi:hypothetical protein
VIEEVFIYVRGKEAEDDGMAIYAQWKQWMKSSNATRFRFNEAKGAPMDKIKALFGPIKSVKKWFVVNE